MDKENITVAGLKDMNHKLFKIQHSLEGIGKSLKQMVKIMNRQVPPAQRQAIEDLACEGSETEEDENDDEM